MANTRLEIAVLIFVRSINIGVISGVVMGTLFMPLWSFPVPAIFGLGLGLALGIVNGLLLSLVTCLLFYPLRQVQLYRATLKIISVALAGSGVAAFGPIQFSSTSMTVSSAVLIGLSSVQASLVAGWSGALAAQNISQWYEQVSTKSVQTSAGRKDVSSITLYGARHPFQFFRRAVEFIGLGWIGAALLALTNSLGGTWLLQRLICGTQDIRGCFQSPSLYTSVAAGFRAALPIVFIVILTYAVLHKILRRHR